MAQKQTAKSKTQNRQILAYRKSCDPKGTGLSHFIFMDKEKK